MKLSRVVPFALITLVSAACSGGGAAGSAIATQAAGPSSSATTVPSAAPFEGTITYAYSSDPSMKDVPNRMALEDLRSQGYAVEEVTLAGPELAAAAIAQGDAQFSNGVITLITAIQEGGQIRMIAEASPNEWAAVVSSDIQSCKDQDGKRIAIHSQGSLGAALHRAWINSECPGTEPDWVVIAGSENRAVALLAGEIDGTQLALAEQQIVAEENATGFHVLTDFAVSLPLIFGGAQLSNPDFINESPQVVEDYLEALLGAYRAVRADPDLLIAGAVELGADPEQAEYEAEQYLELGWPPANGGLSQESLEFAIQFLTDEGYLQPGMTVEQVADTAPLQRVLERIGTE